VLGGKVEEREQRVGVLVERRDRLRVLGAGAPLLSLANRALAKLTPPPHGLPTALPARPARRY